MPELTAEDRRLEEIRLGKPQWRRWGPYVSDRSWGTVREDYSHDGDAWTYFTHDMARSRAYRWGEDAIAGFCDRYQVMAFAFAFWNGRDPILKERYYGLTPREANHGEDVKEYYFYLDCTPTHSYQKMLYKYPQGEYPYRWLLEENRSRNTRQGEFELMDTGIFDQDRYFDIFIEYAKADVDDLCIRIEVFNRGPDDAPLHILPHLWFRNRWSWTATPTPAPVISAMPTTDGSVCLLADEGDSVKLLNLPFEYSLDKRYLYGESGGKPLFTDNETNFTKIWGPRAKNKAPFTKDAFHRQIINGEDACNPAGQGSKACLHYPAMNVPAGKSITLTFRLTDKPMVNGLKDVNAIVDLRKKEADEFYARIHPPRATADEKLIQRQAFAGMLWSKQIYLFDVAQWMDGDNPDFPPPPEHKLIRNMHWRHLNSMRVLSMPDKWEYPWFAAWDLAFHTVPIALVDIEFAKEQLWLLLFEQFQHPNGQIPAYEWEYSDLNPPVQAWAIWRVYYIERDRWGREDRRFLEKCFHKLLINFAWWVNRVDVSGNNLFEGGFLGLDNITVVDRSQPLGEGTKLYQSDATGWMGMFCLDLMRIALELARTNHSYLGLATKFFEHFVYIGAALNRRRKKGYELWSEKEGFFYDVLLSKDGAFHKLRVRSLVGIIPMYAVKRIDSKLLDEFPDFRDNFEWFLANRAELASRCVVSVEKDGRKIYILKLITEDQMRKILSHIADPAEFASDYGMRSLSKVHEKEPFKFQDKVVEYEPAEAWTILKGGNSNWRGPIWFPTTFLLIESFKRLSDAYSPDYIFPSSMKRSHIGMTFRDLMSSMVEGMISIFKRNDNGIRPVHGHELKFQTDPHWKDLILFYEYFHADTGEGLGASHQTGWTGLVATLIDEWRR